MSTISTQVALLLLVLLVLGALIPAWLFIDVRRRQRSTLWLVFGLMFGWLTALVWLWSRRRSPPVVHLTGREKLRLGALATMLYVALAIGCDVERRWGYQVARVEGQSMSPTLNDQDRLVVSHLAYLLDTPRTGDLVMFHYPLDPSKSFVKRIVAAGGDQVAIEDGRVIRNGVVIEEPYVSDTALQSPNFGPVVVPESHYFVVGDCRHNSSDSRHYGFIPSLYVAASATGGGLASTVSTPSNRKRPEPIDVRRRREAGSTPRPGTASLDTDERRTDFSRDGSVARRRRAGGFRGP